MIKCHILGYLFADKPLFTKSNRKAANASAMCAEFMRSMSETEVDSHLIREPDSHMHELC